MMPGTPAEPAIENTTRADHHGSGVNHPVDAADAKRARSRKWIRITLVFLALVALLVALTPKLLSTGPGTRWLVSIVNGKVPGELKVDDLSLSWFAGQRVQGVTYADPAKGLHAQIALIDLSDIGLFELITGSRKFGNVALSKADITYTLDPKAKDASKHASTQKQSGDRQPLVLPPGLSGTLAITNSSVTCITPGLDEVVLTLANDEIKVADIRDITFRFDAVLRQGVKTGKVSLNGGVLNLFDPEGKEQFHQAAYDISFVVDDVPTATLDQVISGMRDDIAPGRVMGLLGEGELVSRATIKGTIEQLASDLEINTPKLRVEIDQRTDGKTLVASPGSYARLDLDQAGFAALFPKSGLKLVELTGIDLASLQMSLPIIKQAVDWDAATASLVLKAGDNLAVIDERGEKLWINDLQIVGNSDSIADKLSFKLTTMLSAVDADSEVTREPVAVDVIVREPLEKTRQIDFFSEALPIRLADALVGQEGRLVLWLGEMLALQADVQGKLVTDEQGNTRLIQHFALRPEGRVTGTVSGSFGQGRYRFSTQENQPIEAELVPAAFASLMEMLSGRPGEPALTIDKSMPVFLTLRDPKRGGVSITTREDKAGLKRFYPDPDQTYLGATLELSPATVFDPKRKKTYELRGGKITLSAPDLRGRTEVRAELDLWVRPDAGEQGVSSLLTWQTTISDLLDTEGSMPLDGAALMQQIAATGGMKLENVPSGLMDTLLNRDGDLASILGPIVQEMDAGFTYTDGQPTGASVRLNWDSVNKQPIPGAWASMKPAVFDINDQQMLTVRGGEDLEIEVRVSEEFGNRWMGQLHPILFDAKSGDRPVKIKIDGGSFKFPLQGEGMAGANVQATVDLGSVQFGDDALLGKLLNWAGRPGEKAIFEPAKVSLVDGKISYDQFDLAVGNVKLRLDGEVDLVSGQIVDMAVRVPGESLIRVFNELDGIIAADDFLSIPMTGEIRKPTFDQKLIGREVARLVTRSLIDQQKDKLGDLIRKGIGGDDKPQPKPQDNNPPEGDGQQPEQQPEGPEQDPAKDPAKDEAQELVDRALDLIFKRRGPAQEEPKQE